MKESPWILFLWSKKLSEKRGYFTQMRDRHSREKRGSPIAHKPVDRRGAERSRTWPGIAGRCSSVHADTRKRAGGHAYACRPLLSALTARMRLRRSPTNAACIWPPAVTPRPDLTCGSRLHQPHRTVAQAAPPYRLMLNRCSFIIQISVAGRWRSF